MNIKKGIVMKTEKDVVYIMTNLGEFLKLKIDNNNAVPIIGEEYSGVVIENKSINSTPLKYALTACLIFFMLTFGGGVYAYYKPVSTITININPSVKLSSNKWGRVIYTKALNSDGEKVLQKLHLKNIQTDNAITLFIDQAKKDNFINDNYIENNKEITINITGKEANVSSFKKKLKKYDLNIELIDNGVTIFNQSAKLRNKDLSKSYINIDTKSNNDSNINISQYKTPNINDNLGIKANNTNIAAFNENTKIKNNSPSKVYTNMNTENNSDSHINTSQYKIPSITDINNNNSISNSNASINGNANSNSNAISNSIAISNSNANGNADGNGNANGNKTKLNR